MRHWNQHLSLKVATSFFILSLLAVGVVGGVAFLKAREALKKASFERLSVAASLKEEEITRWFEDQLRDFFLITKYPDVQQNLERLLKSTSDDPAQRAAYKTLSKYLMDVAETKPGLREIFILDRSYQTILSTNKQREGQYETFANITYVEEIKPKGTFTPIFYVSPINRKLSVTLATPLRDSTGVRQGVILAHLDLNRIDQIVRERTGLGKSGETYLVGSLITKNTFIAKAQTNSEDFPEGVSSQGIDAAMSGISSSGLYHNYAGVPVIGVYRWLSEQDLALLVEMQQEEAFAPARQLAGAIVLMALTAMGALLLGVSWLTRQLKISHEQLESYSHKLEQKAQEAEAANRAKSEFLANMSHELRTPLNAILGFTQLMTRGTKMSAQQLENLEIISRSGEHLLALINDVLSMAKIEAGRTTFDEDSFDLYGLLDALEEMLQLKAASKGLDLVFVRSFDVPQYIQTDESKIQQILINLVGNAIKFTQEGRVILRVSKVPMAARLLFEVEDTGPGISPQELENLFKPFVQTETGRKSHQGTGLGLTISQKFVNLMGGKLSVSSTLHRGTLFSFDLPIHCVTEAEVKSQQQYRRAIALAPDQPQYRILVVEDKWENRQLLVKILESLGFEVREAENGQQGVAIWQSWEPHLIWMDMRMPIMDGYEATKQIKSHLKGHATIIIALTASAFDEEKVVILSAGCDDFVRKPFREEVILDKMAQYLGVRYIYEEEVAHSDRLKEGAELEYSSVKTALAQMPPEWVAQLHQAALCTDEKQIFSLIEQIPEEMTPLANTLADLVNNFRIDQVIDLTQPDLT